MGYLLLVNDDGPDSPALVPLARALQKLGPVRVVVPSGERSWVGKAVSRWSGLRVETIDREGLEIVTVDGYPADCGNLGVHSLFEEPPEVVVSGVNVGLNVGAGFFHSSGTVGAAMEGAIAGLPAYAFSTGIAGADRDWKRTASSGPRQSDWELAAELATDLVRTIQRAGYPSDVDLLNVNFALGTPLDAPREITHVAPPGYSALFKRRPDGEFRFDLSPGPAKWQRPSAGSDVAAVSSGRVSITPIRLGASTPISEDSRSRLTRPA